MADKIQVDFGQMAKAIKRAAQGSKNEAQLREKVQPLWEDFLRANGSDLALRHMQHERHFANGYADTVFNKLVIEYKRPSSFGTKRQIGQAITQMRIYCEDLAKEERWLNDVFAAKPTWPRLPIHLRFPIYTVKEHYSVLLTSIILSKSP